MSDKKKWKNEFNSKLFFSHGKTNYGTKKLDKINKKCDKSGRIYFLELNTDDSFFVLVNTYNANTEPDQLKTLTGLGKIIYCVYDIQNKNIIFSSDVNVIFDYFLEVQR